MAIAFAVGVIVAALGSWSYLRRHLRAVRAAERRARAAERMAEIGAMTGGLAHEIKNPLSTIGLNAQLLAESIQDLSIEEDERSRLLGRVRGLRREVERLRGILVDFLEYAGKVHLEVSRVDLGAVVDELADFYMPEAERHGVRIRVDRNGDPLLASVDPKLIKQALLNLMINATQAMASQAGGDRAGGNPGDGSPPDRAPRAGELILRTRSGKDAEGGPVVQIHVIDTGPGIPTGTIEKIFQPYFTTRSGGSGLGLPVARRLIEEHGGRIEVHSEVGRGTDFTVVLPCEPLDQPADATSGIAPGR
jgi:signal transduction histidine kinase